MAAGRRVYRRPRRSLRVDAFFLPSAIHRQWISELVQRAGIRQLADLEIGLHSDSLYKAEFKRGWINRFRAYCARLGVDLGYGALRSFAPRTIVLARNVVQHPKDIVSIRARPSEHHLPKDVRNFFAADLDLAMFGRFSRPARMSVTEEKLLTAIDEVERFAAWLDCQHPMHKKA